MPTFRTVNAHILYDEVSDDFFDAYLVEFLATFCDPLAYLCGGEL